MITADVREYAAEREVVAKGLSNSKVDGPELPGGEREESWANGMASHLRVQTSQTSVRLYAEACSEYVIA